MIGLFGQLGLVIGWFVEQRICIDSFSLNDFNFLRDKNDGYKAFSDVRRTNRFFIFYCDQRKTSVTGRSCVINLVLFKLWPKFYLKLCIFELFNGVFGSGTSCANPLHSAGAVGACDWPM